MRNKIRSIFLVTCIFLSLLPWIRVKADSLSLYYQHQDVSIGLESMAGKVITITFNGDYKSGNMEFKKDEIKTLNYTRQEDGTESIQMDGQPYNSISFKANEDNSTIKIESTGISRQYKGEVHFVIANGTIVPINTVNIELYLKGVVGSEMSDFYPIEALKAQAVAARNYALYNIEKHSNSGYDLCDGTHCQAYKGYNTEYSNSSKAVDDTRGIVLNYGDSLVQAYFSASNGGYEEACKNVWVQDIPYLTSQRDDFDGPGKYPSFFTKGNWTSYFTPADIDRKLKDSKRIGADDKFLSIQIDALQFYDSGRVSRVVIDYEKQDGSKSSITLQKESARIFLGLNSSLYKVTYDSGTDTYMFSGEGWGHGIGMSQIGAYNRANSGQTFEDILKFYYKGSNIKYLLPSINNIDIKSYAYTGNKIGTGDTIAINISASGGSGQGYLYDISISASDNSIKDAVIADLKDNESSYFEFRPLLKAKYKLSITVKDQLYRTVSSNKKDIFFDVVNVMPEDINLDGIVDIYDLTALSKRIDLEKATAPIWNDRWNQNSVDEKIDIKDIAKVAQAYNKKNDNTNVCFQDMADKNSVIQYATGFIGVPYVYGSTGPDSFDTSSFVAYVYKHFGILLPRTIDEQMKYGVPITKEELQSGDVVFFGKGTAHHVGIYVGNGCYIHAPQTGDVVKVSLMTRTDFLMGRRFVP